MAQPTRRSFCGGHRDFFEKPAQLRKEHPELYEELYGFYRVNPVEWE